jgi:hypothetical protein
MAGGNSRLRARVLNKGSQHKGVRSKQPQGQPVAPLLGFDDDSRHGSLTDTFDARKDANPGSEEMLRKREEIGLSRRRAGSARGKRLV